MENNSAAELSRTTTTTFSCATTTRTKGNETGSSDQEHQEQENSCCTSSSSTIIATTTTTTTTTATHSNTTARPTKLQQQLLEQAASVRTRLGSTPPPQYLKNQDLFFPSKYWQCHKDKDKFSQEKHNSEKDLYNEQMNEHEQQMNERGFCNWLVPNKIMIGQYPGQNPLRDGPSKHEVKTHFEMICGCTSNSSSTTGSSSTISSNSSARVTLFCSLQSETPAQDTDEEWGTDGQVYLEPESIRDILPRPFTQYAPLAREMLLLVDEPIFIHVPMKDLHIPESQEALQQLLLELLQFLDTNNSNQKEDSKQEKAMYIHCWGGRGRAAVVGSCLISLIWPTLSAQDILEWVQRGYETRLGHDTLSEEFAYYPQTAQQRAFVTRFVQEYQALLRVYNKNNNTSSS